ncbi:MAG: hypothetical protein AAGF75_07215 [Cyanobacteria bacterium P01_H01_bin.130]
MTQRERIMARLQTMPDASLHEVETFLEFLQFKHSAFDCPLPEQLNGALERWGSMPEGLDVRLDILVRIRAGFQRIRSHRANTLTLYEVYRRSGPQLALDRPTFHEILVELSSPFVGYLGREEGISGDYDYFWLEKG